MTDAQQRRRCDWLAEKVMGWCRCEDGLYWESDGDVRFETWYGDVWNPYEDGGHAMMLLEKHYADGCRVCMTAGEGYVTVAIGPENQPGEWFSAQQSDVPAAICNAALKATGFEESIPGSK